MISHLLSKTIWLRKKVGHQFVVIRYGFARKIHGLLRFHKSNKISRNYTPLVQKLVEGMLPNGAGFAKNDLSAFMEQRSAIESYSLSIALGV